MCLRLHVLHPFLDFVWDFRGGPPPGPAISGCTKEVFGVKSERFAACRRDRFMIFFVFKPRSDRWTEKEHGSGVYILFGVAFGAYPNWRYRTDYIYS